MSQQTEDKKRGIIALNVLYNGDIRQCFQIPKDRPPGQKYSVTVDDAAMIQESGGRFILTRRGSLSVTSA